MDGFQAMGTAQYLQAVLKHVATNAVQGAAYDKWTDDFSRKKVRDAWRDEDYQPFRRRVTVAELQALPVSDLRMLGFGGWDDKLTVIPLWAWHFIADGEELTCIDGTKAVKGKDEIDLDTRFGCIAWGFQTPAA